MATVYLPFRSFSRWDLELTPTKSAQVLAEVSITQRLLGQLENTSGGTWTTPPWGSIMTATPLMFVYYTGPPITSPTAINVAPPLLYSQDALSLPLPDNAGQDVGSSITANQYIANIPGYGPVSSTSSSLLGLTPGANVCFIPETSNTSTTPSFSLSSAATGFTITLKDGTALSTSPPDIAAGHTACVVLDPNDGGQSYWQLINPQASGGSGVVSFNTRTGDVVLAAADVDAVDDITNSTSGTAAALSAPSALPNGTTATTQTCDTNLADVATGQYVAECAAGGVTTYNWSRQGIYMAPIFPGVDPSPQVQESSELYGPPELATDAIYSQVIKGSITSGWGTAVGVQECFFESPDRFTTPVRIGTCIANHFRGTLENFGTILSPSYVLYAKNGSTNGLDIYTGSTLAGLSLLHSNVISCGSNGNETSASLARVTVWGSGSSWSMLYACEDSSNSSYAEWLATAATSTASSWTKSSTSPVIGSTSAGSSSACFDYSGFQVVGVSGSNLWGAGHCGPSGLVPTPYIWRSTSTNNGATWKQDAGPMLQAQTADEGGNLTDGQLGDPFFLDGGTLNSTAMYYTAYSSGCSGCLNSWTTSDIKVAVVPVPVATLASSLTQDGGVLRPIPVAQVGTNQVIGNLGTVKYQGGVGGTGGVNVTDMQNGSLQFTNGVTASDNFNRAAGALGANWAGSGNITIQAPSSAGDTAGGTTNDVGYYTGAGTFGPDQCATINLLTSPTSSLGTGPVVRAASGTGYVLDVANASGTAANFGIYKNVSGTLTLLSSTTSSTGAMAQGDNYSLCVVGTTLTSYRNNAQVNTITDSTYATGSPGIFFNSNNAARVSFWAGWSNPTSSAINQLTGDVTAGPGSGSQAATLATVNSGPGSCGDSTHVCQITTNGKGLVTAQSNVAISGGGSTGADINITGSSQITAAGCTQSASTGGYCAISGSSTTAVTFSVIPGTYNALKIVEYGASTSGTTVHILGTFNGDTGSNYATNGSFQNDTSGPGSAGAASQSSCVLGVLASTGANSGVVLIPGYADTSFDKSATLQSTSLASLSSTANNQYLDYGCGWASTSAITSITLTIGSGDYAANTKFMIYGIN